MASAANMIGTFAGEREEDVELWLRKVDMAFYTCMIDEREKVRMLIRALRGTALEWVTLLGEELLNMGIETFKESLISRFCNRMDTEMVVARFFATGNVKSYQEYVELLKDATFLMQRGSVGCKSLIQRIISKSPDGIKSILLIKAEQVGTWDSFRKVAEESAWVAFPERLIGQVGKDNDDKEDKNEQCIQRIAKEKKYCHVHGEGNHFTNECEIVKLVESKGWIRRRRDEKFNKNKRQEKFYTVRNFINTSDNPFKISGKLAGKTVEVLIDTGADISIIPYDILKDSVEKRRVQTVAKTVNGSPLNITHQAIDLEIELFDKRLTISPYICKNMYGNHIIIGADHIKHNTSLLELVIKPLKFAKEVATCNVEKKETQEDSMAGKNDIIDHYQDMFVEDLENAGTCKVLKHQIHIRGDYPLAQKNFPISIHYEDEIEKEVQKWLKIGVIQESNSPWASRLVPVRKKDGRLRLCIDYRPLNEITIRDQYPLPRIDSILDTISNAKVFSCLDATSGYHQLEIDSKDREKTAFRYKGGLYEFIRMPFGLTNAPATFQRVMDIILKEVNWKCAIPYLDDIIIFSQDEKQHKKDVKHVMELLKNNNIKLNPAKCKFFKKELRILGNVVSEGSVKPDPEKVRILKDIPQPTDIKALRGFLGLLNYFRDYIPNLSTHASKLYELLKGEEKRSCKKITWNIDLNECFKKVKNLLTDATTRMQPDKNADFILTTDASEIGIGAILSQKNAEGKERMVYAFSKVLDETQKRYSTTDKELLAVVKSIEYFKRFLLGRKFLLRTDHKAIQYLWSCSNTNARMLRWALKLSEFQFDIEYIKGENNNADFLSRHIGAIKQSVEISKLNKDEKETKMEKVHLMLGHGSVANMEHAWEKKDKWSGFSKDLKEFYKKCRICALGSNQLPTRQLKCVKSEKPGQLWELDLIGRIVDKKGNASFIFLAQDNYTKWIEGRVISNKKAKTIKECINELIVNKHGTPEELYCDHGREFVNEDIKQLCTENKIRLTFASAYHHQSTGGIERANQTLLSKLRKLSNFGQINWKGVFKNAILAMNLSLNRAIGTSPYMLYKNMKPCLTNNGNSVKEEELGRVDAKLMKKMYQKTRMRYEDEIRQKYKRKGSVLTVGSKVLIYNGVPSQPFKQRWFDGFTLKRVLENGSYLVAKGNRIYKRASNFVKLDESYIGEGGVGL